MAKFLYPVDTFDFKKIRRQGKVYVDKTDMVFDLAHKFNFVFLSRPRRFGKSLLCDTFKNYFEGQKELFEGLKIMDLEKEWKRYPVLHFSMSCLKNMTVAEAKSVLEGSLRDYEEIYGRKEGDVTPGTRLKTLIRNAARQTGENVVVILDEYDSPIMNCIYEKEKLEEMRTLLREFYQVLKDEDTHLRFVFITGITKFSQLSIFSEINNLKQISMMDEYSGLCGITQEELDTVLRPCVEDYAEGLGVTTDDAYSLLKKNYDGYHFSENSADVYAPFSLLNALNDKKINYYWFESSTPRALIEHLNHFGEFNPLDYDGAVVTIDAFNAPCENAKTPLPLLYQTGYLTIDSYDSTEGDYTLHFPNFEVKHGMVKCMANYMIDSDGLDEESAARGISIALKSGDLSSALISMRSYIASIPYDIISKKEWMKKQSCEAFYKMLMYTVFTLLNCRVHTEIKCIRGRADIVIETAKDIFILELKVDQPVDQALRQIDNMGYAVPYEADPRPVTKCGVCISSEMRNISEWKITDAGGVVIENKEFTNE